MFKSIFRQRNAVYYLKMCSELFNSSFDFRMVYMWIV